VSDVYRRAGVDTEAAAKAVALIGEAAASTHTPQVVGSIGGFAGTYRLGDGRLLAAATDGAGTKTEIARRTHRLDTIGIDLVAMSVNDVACTGAFPLFFLDCIVVGHLVPEDVAAIVSGVAEGCLRADCALLGGETAEHPGLLEPDRFDLTGTCVGIVDEDGAIGPHRVVDGDVLVGLASSGLHANGYSLVRTALVEAGSRPLDEIPRELDRPLADELLEPTEIYAPFVPTLAAEGSIAAAAHITGGGFFENVPRALPPGLGAEVERGTWPEPPIFKLVQSASGAGDDEMFATFNMGIGMVLVTGEDRAAEVIERAAGRAWRIGRVVPGAGLEVRW
jgi:phosphoribosylformylglycinamidine cyclo-ligase